MIKDLLNWSLDGLSRVLFSDIHLLLLNDLSLVILALGRIIGYCVALKLEVGSSHFSLLAGTVELRLAA
jgi:hypothetical protein